MFDQLPSPPPTDPALSAVTKLYYALAGAVTLIVAEAVRQMRALGRAKRKALAESTTDRREIERRDADKVRDALLDAAAEITPAQALRDRARVLLAQVDQAPKLEEIPMPEKWAAEIRKEIREEFKAYIDPIISQMHKRDDEMLARDKRTRGLLKAIAKVLNVPGSDLIED